MVPGFDSQCKECYNWPAPRRSGNEDISRRGELLCGTCKIFFVYQSYGQSFVQISNVTKFEDFFECNIS